MLVGAIDTGEDRATFGVRQRSLVSQICRFCKGLQGRSCVQTGDSVSAAVNFDAPNSLRKWSHVFDGTVQSRAHLLGDTG